MDGRIKYEKLAEEEEERKEGGGQILDEICCSKR